MATIDFRDSLRSGADMRFSDFFYGRQTADTDRVQSYSDGEFTIIFRGQFGYNALGLDGIVHSIVEKRNGTTLYTATDIGADAGIIWDYRLYDDNHRALRYLTSGNDIIDGTRFNDVLLGNAGRDDIYGDHGADRIDGGIGADAVAGGLGRDRLAGGTGADVFEFYTPLGAGLGRRSDVVTDFSRFQGDSIDLSAIDANSEVRGNQSFDYIGGSGFSGSAGDLRYKGGVISGDVNGDRVADFQIKIDNGAALNAFDFWL